jgi:hypothetical protein
MCTHAIKMTKLPEAAQLLMEMTAVMMKSRGHLIKYPSKSDCNQTTTQLGYLLVSL